MACWTEALPARCVRVGVFMLWEFAFLEALAKLANLISLPIIICAFPALLSVYSLPIKPNVSPLSKDILRSHSRY
jgi:hypothetical protein